MRTTFLKYITLIIILLFISGCPDFFEEPMAQKYETGMGGFSLTINEPGRTIMPAAVQGDFAAYTLEFFAAGTTTEPGVTVNRTNADLSVPVLLNAGIWDLHITAFLEDGNGELKPAAYGILERINIGEGETVDGFVSLKPIIDGGMGTFSWNIDYPLNVTAASMTIIPLNETDGMTGTVQYFIGAGGEPLVGKEDSLSLNAGYYRVDFELQLNDERRAVRREILHIYQNMESFFSFTFTDMHFPADPLGVILTAWDDDTSRWYLSGADITAEYFIIAGVEGVDDDNFEDIINWFDSAINSPAADVTELKILVDLALVGAAGNNTFFCDAGSYADRDAAEAAIGLLIKNGTPIEIMEWDSYTAVTVELAGLYQVQITFNGEILPPITGIEIAELPKTDYLMGEIFSLTGLRVSNVYADGTRRETSSYTVNQGNNQVINGNFRSGSFPVTVSAGGYNSSFDITVSNTLVDTGLPVIYIETQNAAPIDSKEIYRNMNFAITSDNPAYRLEKTGFRDEIRGRGNGTWPLPKKPYRIRFSEDTSLFGMVPSRSWVLLANYRDPTLLSNTIAFELGWKFGLPFTCHYVHVEVVLNGEYQGSYLLTEHMRDGEGRVDIDRNTGYLVELDNWFNEDARWRTPNHRIPVMIKLPDLGEILNQPGYDFVRESVNEFDTIFSDPNFPNNNYLDLIDIDNFVDFFMINEIVGNTEVVMPHSVYMYKRDMASKLKLGPLWDFDAGYGLEIFNVTDLASVDLSTAEARLVDMRPALWGKFVVRLYREDHLFNSKYKTRWNEKLSDILSISAFIDEMYNRLEASQSLNSRRWYTPNFNYEYEVGKLKEWWNRRMVYLNREINNTPNVGPDSLEGKLLILQAYGSSSDAAGVSHSFVELYNTTNSPINLNGFSLYYADGHRRNDADFSATEDKPWNMIRLNGTIPARGSFLILGTRQNTTGRYQIPDNYGDINDPDFTLSNRMFKVALARGTSPLTVQNPFDIDGNGTKITGYIDMVGARNTAPNAGFTNNYDKILGFENAPTRNSASEAVRRKNLVDTNNNSNDFIAARYASDGMSDEELAVRHPRNSVAGPWDPFRAPAPPPSGNTLLIFQVHGTGFGAVDNGNNTNTGSVSHSFVELYNNSDTPVSLDTYSVQWANGIANAGGTVQTTVDAWRVIPLSGTIPAYGSYLIRGAHMNDENGQIGRLQITTFDKDVPDFEMSNRSYKVALVSRQTALTLSNPWDNDTGEPLDPHLIDLIGARNGNSDSVDAYKGAMRTMSKQNSVRRSSLTDTGNNSVDFVQIDYRTADLSVNRPRTATDGSWNPFQ